MKLLIKHFQEYAVFHVKRGANGAAHTSAKLALTLGDDRMWVEDFPPCMLSCVAHDMSDS